MEYKFFDKEFLVMPDDEDIIGKQCIFANTLPSLIDKVESADIDMNLETGVAIENVEQFPFVASNTEYRLCYYDPNYECKVAYSQGKKIQYRTYLGEWVDVVDKPLWCVRDVYRVKPEEIWYVHQDIDGHYFKSDSDTITIEFKGTEKECDAWIAEHTPKTRRMTNKELMRWLAEGKGERVDVTAEYVSLYYSYEKGMDDEECDKDIRIRAWDETDWHEPLVEVKE